MRFDLLTACVVFKMFVSAPAIYGNGEERRVMASDRHADEQGDEEVSQYYFE